MSIKLFISYAHEDEEYRDQLSKHLSDLKRSGAIEKWDDNKIVAGQEWDKKIKSALMSADIILFLISVDFMNSDYIHDVEIRSAMERYKKKEVVIIPILIRFCVFSSLELNQFQSLPSDKPQIPIVKWKIRDEAWVNVVNGIKDAISEITKTVPGPKVEKKVSVVGPSAKKALPIYLQHTCDRRDHSDVFNQIFNNYEEQKVKFFYIYGEKYQSPVGFFIRIKNEKKRRNKKNRHFIFVPKDASTLNAYKTNLIAGLFDQLVLDTNEHAPILEKNLRFVIDKSPETKGMGKDDSVFILIKISGLRWSADRTPQCIQWFTDSFCTVNPLPEDAPEVVIFFAFIYKKKNAEMKGEIEGMMKQEPLTIPELDNVTEEDIEKWFQEQTVLAATERSRDALFEEHFSDIDEKDMEYVEVKLKKVIDEHNQK